MQNSALLFLSSPCRGFVLFIVPLLPTFTFLFIFHNYFIRWELVINHLPPPINKPNEHIYTAVALKTKYRYVLQICRHLGQVLPESRSKENLCYWTQLLKKCSKREWRDDPRIPNQEVRTGVGRTEGQPQGCCLCHRRYDPREAGLWACAGLGSRSVAPEWPLAVGPHHCRQISKPSPAQQREPPFAEESLILSICLKTSETFSCP